MLIFAVVQYFLTIKNKKRNLCRIFLFKNIYTNKEYPHQDNNNGDIKEVQ